jgi:hypothetical protein
MLIEISLGILVGNAFTFCLGYDNSTPITALIVMLWITLFIHMTWSSYEEHIQ